MKLKNIFYLFALAAFIYIIYVGYKFWQAFGWLF